MIKRIEAKIENEVDYLTAMQFATYKTKEQEVDKNYCCLLCNKVSMPSEIALAGHLKSIVLFY